MMTPTKNIPTWVRAMLATALVSLFAACAGSPTTVAGGVTYSGYWRIKCNGDADSAGQVRFRIVPKGEAATDVTIDIPKGTSENAVAKMITRKFSDTLDKERFHVERDDWEDVCIRERGKDAGFAVQFVESNIAGVSFKVVLD